MAWTNLPTDQRQYIADIEANLLALRRKVSPATLYSTTAPTVTEIEAAWATKYPPAYTPNSYEMLQWVDPSSNSLMNYYGQFGSVPGQRTLIEFPASPVPWTKLGEYYADDAGLASPLNFSGISQIYSSLYVYVLLRSSVAALTANAFIQLNGVASALYSYNFQGALSTAALAGEQTGQAGFLLPIPANTSHRGFYHEGLFRVLDYTSVLRKTRVHHRGVYATGVTISGTASNNVNGFGIYNPVVAIPITSLAVLTATGFASGSRVVLFGV